MIRKFIVRTIKFTIITLFVSLSLNAQTTNPPEEEEESEETGCAAIVRCTESSKISCTGDAVCSANAIERWVKCDNSPRKYC